MARRCCCGSVDCMIIDTADKLQAKDFFEVFSATGDFSVECWGTYDTITFTGSVDLELIYPDAIFSGDNLAFSFNGYSGCYVDNLDEGDTTTEVLTFTFGDNPLTANVLEVEYIRMNGYSSGVHDDCTFTVTYNGHLLYKWLNNSTTPIDYSLNTTYTYDSLLTNKHYLIRKEGRLQYYSEIGGILTLLGVAEDANLNDSIHVSYSWSSTSSDATILFNPSFLQIWKPDKWWLLGKYNQTIKRLPEQFPNTEQARNEAHDLYNVYANNEVESQGCESVETGTAVNPGRRSDTNSDMLFSELSPKIAIKFTGFINTTDRYISGVPILAQHTVKVDDGGGNYHYETIDDMNTIIGEVSALTGPDVMDLDSIMETQADAWDLPSAQVENYLLEWYNGGKVSLDYDSVSSQVLNAITGGDKIIFQQMVPMTVMYNNQWYYADIEDEWHNFYHQGFDGHNWCTNSSYGIYGNVYRQLGGDFTHTCRNDPFAFYYAKENSNQGYNSPATDVFAMRDVTLEFRKGIVAPDIDINISSVGIPTIDFKFYKPKTDNYTGSDWRTPHIVDVATPDVIEGGPYHVSVAKAWHAISDPNSAYEGYYVLEYTNSAGGITADYDYFVYELEDQFGAKSKGLITIYFVGDTANETIEYTVTPVSDATPSMCNDYDTLCEVTCTVPYNLVRNALLVPQSVSPLTIYLYYVHDGKIATVADLISHGQENPKYAEFKYPSPWIDISGTTQSTLKAVFVDPVYGDCELAHDNNFGLENPITLDGATDNVLYLEAHIQLWDYSGNTPTVVGNPFTCQLDPTTSMGCPSNSGIGIKHYSSPGTPISTTYEGSFQRTINGSTYTVNLTVSTDQKDTLPYNLGTYLGPGAISGSSIKYVISKIAVVYPNNKTVDISLTNINTDDYPDLVLGDFYND